MGINKFTEAEVIELRQNSYVEKVSTSSITYTESFKEFFILKHHQGIQPMEIFRSAGFNPTLLGSSRISNASSRWRKQAMRESGLKDTRKENSGRPKTRNLSEAEELKLLKNQVAYLKAENDFLKKLEQAEREAIWKANSKQKKNLK